MNGENGRIRPVFIVLALCGAALLAYLLKRAGIGDVASAFAAARWGVLAVIVFHLVPLFMDTLTWWNLFPRENRPLLPAAFRMRWMGESVSYVLPFSSVGGDIVRARLAALKGAPMGIAAATVLADITLGIVVQTLFTLTGVLLLLNATGRAQTLGPLLAGAALAALAVSGFYAAQHFGMFRILGGLVKRIAKDPSWHALADKGGGIDAGVRTVYGRRRGVALACLCTIGAWLASSAEVWIALRAAGLEVGFDKAVILESMTQGVRAIVFFIPGALGVQEWGYEQVGSLIGIPGNIALALSLIRRARELALGSPGVIAWAFSEGHRFWIKRGIQASE